MEPFEMDDDWPLLVSLTPEIVAALITLCQSPGSEYKAAGIVQHWLTDNLDFIDDDEPANPVQFDNTDPEF